LFHTKGRWLVSQDLLVAPGAAALWNQSGSPWLESCFRRRKLSEARWFGLPEPIQPPILSARQDASFIFLPFLRFDHFGHLLTETAAWLGPLLDKPKARDFPSRILLGSGAAKSLQPLADLLSWDSSQILTTDELSTITSLSQVWLPVPSMVNRDHVHPLHRRVVCFASRRY
jgi:hypothetical protein